jgi:hypothetical protein
MKFRLLLGLALVAMPLAAAPAMPVSTFLTKADALQKKGPLAAFSGDLKLLMNQIKRDAGELRADNKALEAAGKTKAYCAPAGGVKLSNRDILQAMNEVPAAQRPTIQTKAALRAYFARRWPCPKV